MSEHEINFLDYKYFHVLNKICKGKNSPNVYAPYDSRITKVFIREMLEEILTNNGQMLNKNCAGEKEVKILFGEYMGEADLLFSVGRENIYEIFQNIC